MDKSSVTSNSMEEIELMLMKCSLCDGNYSEDRVPRNLICGHSCCTKCLTVRFANEKTCPECHEKQTVNNAADLPINYPLLRLMRLYNSKVIDLKGIRLPKFPSNVHSFSDLEINAAKCPAHGSPTVFLCFSCSMWVCQDCLVVDHPCLPRGCCRVLGITEAISNIKKVHQERTNMCLKEVEHVKMNLEPEMARHDFCMKYCQLDIRSHKRLVMEINRELEEIKQKDELEMECIVERLKHLTNLVNNATSPEGLTRACKELADCENDLNKYRTNDQERKVVVQQKINVHLKLHLKDLAEEERRPVYAVLKEGERTRWALVTSRDNYRLVVYSLTEERPPSYSIIIPFQFVRDLVPLESPTVFFEVECSGRIKGRVYLKLYGNSPCSRQIAFLSSGERGPSYKNTCFYEYDEIFKTLKGGDYENNDGTGGRSIIRGTSDYNVNYRKKMKVGLVEYDRCMHAKFLIHLEGKDISSHCAVGMVNKGLEILEVASKTTPITDAVIRDCGFFIPMKD